MATVMTLSFAISPMGEPMALSGRCAALCNRLPHLLVAVDGVSAQARMARIGCPPWVIGIGRPTWSGTVVSGSTPSC